MITEPLAIPNGTLTVTDTTSSAAVNANRVSMSPGIFRYSDDDVDYELTVSHNTFVPKGKTPVKRHILSLSRISKIEASSAGSCCIDAYQVTSKATVTFEHGSAATSAEAKAAVKSLMAIFLQDDDALLNKVINGES